MKVTLLLLMLLIPRVIWAQHIAYHIQGNIKNYKPGQMVYLVHAGAGERLIDSIPIRDGKFAFKGESNISYEPGENYTQSVATLFIDHTGKGINFNKIDYRIRLDERTVYLEQGLTKVDITDSAYKATISPPTINQGHYTLDSINIAYLKKNDTIVRNALKLHKNDGLYLDYTSKLRDVIVEEKKQDQHAFIMRHPLSPVSLYILQHEEDFYPDYDKLAPYFDILSARLKNTAFGKEYGAQLSHLKLTRPGSIAPDFVMNNQENLPIKLSSLKGQYVLIDFWASWCDPCRQENPSVLKAYHQFKNQNFTILGISLDQKKSDWLKAIDDDQLSWPQVADLKLWDNAAAKLYAVTAIPQNFLIDPQGKIIAKNLFGDDLIIKLKQIFGPLTNLK